MIGLRQHELVDQAVTWIHARNAERNLAPIDVNANTPLFENGILDSLGLVALLAFLEEATGNQVDLLELDESEITTLDGLCRAALVSG